MWIIHLRWRAKSIGRTDVYFGRVQSIRVDNVSLKCHPHSCRIYEWGWTKRRDGLKSEFLHLFVKSPIKTGFALSCFIRWDGDAIETMPTNQLSNNLFPLRYYDVSAELLNGGRWQITSISLDRVTPKSMNKFK